MGFIKANLDYPSPDEWENILNLGVNEKINDYLSPEISGLNLQYDEQKNPNTYSFA